MKEDEEGRGESGGSPVQTRMTGDLRLVSIALGISNSRLTLHPITIPNQRILPLLWLGHLSPSPRWTPPGKTLASATSASLLW